MELVQVQNNKVHSSVGAQESRYPPDMSAPRQADKIRPRRHDAQEEHQVDSVETRWVDDAAHRQEECDKYDADLAGAGDHVDGSHSGHLECLP